MAEKKKPVRQKTTKSTDKSNKTKKLNTEDILKAQTANSVVVVPIVDYMLCSFNRVNYHLEKGKPIEVPWDLAQVLRKHDKVK